MKQAPAMPATQTIAPADITGSLLAGGRGTRMGGIDKGLQLFQGEPLALHAIRRLRPQVSALLVNANRNRAAYEAFDALRKASGASPGRSKGASTVRCCAAQA